MVFPYGAMYYRKPCPAPEDWERDHRQMREHGFTCVKHIVTWNTIHLSEDRYDLSDFDRLLDIADAHGIKVVLNTILEGLGGPPHWVWRKYPEAWLLAHDGRRRYPASHGHAVLGGAPGMCLDNDPVRALGYEFLRTVARRYREHPALWGYDVWNEVNSREEPPGPEALYYCYCEATCDRFRMWLRARYGSLEGLEQAWLQRFRDWGDVFPPRARGGYPDCLDWQLFKLENRVEQLRERVALFRAEDPNHPPISHGIAGTSRRLYDYLGDEWFFAREVDEWGVTIAPGRRDDDHRNFFQMADLVRCSARGKPFWLGELQGGHLWLTPELEGRPADDARIAAPEDVRVWSWATLMTGAKGVLHWRYRPEMLGPLTDFFGLCERDGSATPRLAVAGAFAALTARHPEIREAKPVKGDVAILVLHESQRFANVAYPRIFHAWADAVRGAYKAFLDHGVQADFVEIDDLADYALVYLPYPLMVEKANAVKLKEYVRRGGRLVCEAGAASFSDGGFASPRLPGLGLDELLGAGASSSEVTRLMPDLLEDLSFEVGGRRIRGKVGVEQLAPRGSEVLGRFDDGTVAAVEHSFGEGRTIYVGSYPGIAYLQTADAATGQWIAGLLEWAGLDQQVRTDLPSLVARVHRRGDDLLLYVLNVGRVGVSSDVVVSERLGRFREAAPLGSGRAVPVRDGTLRLELPARDGVVLRLMS